MALFRLSLKLNNLSVPNLDSISRLKGYYGIECVFIKSKIEIFIFVEDNYIDNLIKTKAESQIHLYFNFFGIKREDFVNYENEKNNYLHENIQDYKNLLACSFDFSELRINNNKFNTEPPKSNIFENRKKFSSKTEDYKYRGNLIEEISQYLTEIKLNFILQLFCSYKKKKFLISGQLLVFDDNGKFNFMADSIYENIEKILKKNQISLTKSKFSLFNRNSKIKNFLNHKPIKWFEKYPILINEILRIPNLSKIDLSSLSYQYGENFFLNNDFKSGVPIGFKIIPGLKKPPTISISFEELTSHFCCFGITGQGKSRLMYNILSVIAKTDKNFLVIDPKGEYFDALANTSTISYYYKIGSLEFPLSLNIFSVPKGLTVDNHIQFLHSLLLSIMGDDVTPQMNRLLFKAVEFTIENYGSMIDFIKLLEYPESLKIKGSYLDMSGGAILNRILPLIIGPSKNCFYTKETSINFKELIRTNVIIDLSNFELIESTISRKIFVNTFLHYFIHTIRHEKNSIRKLGDISNFILLEEIQKIAPITYQGRNQINSFIGLAPWTVRAYGISLGFIGTDPIVESPIITNTGISIIFYSKANIQYLLKLLGIQYEEYMQYEKELQERRNFLLCSKGNIVLVKSFDFQIPNGESIKNNYENISKLHQ
jgi:hypothetical protein